jgi:hypothetical protein
MLGARDSRYKGRHEGIFAKLNESGNTRLRPANESRRSFNQ